MKQLSIDLNSQGDILRTLAGRVAPMDERILAVSHTGRVLVAGEQDWDLSDWTGILAVSAGCFHAVGLREDGRVLAAGEDLNGQCEVSQWRDMVAVSAGPFYTVGLRADGTVAVTGAANHADVSTWRDMVAVAAGSHATMGLRRDGTVAVTGVDNSGLLYANKNWTDMVALAVGSGIFGLRRDGTVRVGGFASRYTEIFDQWKNMVAITAAPDCVAGLCRDGSVVCFAALRCFVPEGWWNMTGIWATEDYLVGLRADGTLSVHPVRPEAHLGMLRRLERDISAWNLFGAADNDSSIERK